MRTAIVITLAALGFSGGVALAQNNDAAPVPAPAPVVQPGDQSPAHHGGGRRLAGLQAACGADFASLCPGMQPGDGKLGACLRANRAKLSSGCSEALEALRAQRGERQQRPLQPAPATGPNPVTPQ